ncbi:biopolymer transporter ExbD [Erythrobacter sp. NFXS35]|uniref:ExbD/TolR family protein n=1 Tax=Erythrobacter sp. NFXS35 TaxID=2818436 RepID=UPI0032DFD02B
MLRKPRQRRARFDHGEPIRGIDTRPLVFVALFVAILFLIPASQMRTHALLVDLPGSFTAPPGPDDFAPLVHRIRVTEDDRLLFNGVLVTTDELENLLLASSVQPQEIGIAFEPDANASYDLSVRTLAMIKRTDMINQWFCFDGMEKHRQFGKGSGAPFPLLLTLVIPPLKYPPGSQPAEWYIGCASG